MNEEYTIAIYLLLSNYIAESSLERDLSNALSENMISANMTNLSA